MELIASGNHAMAEETLHILMAANRGNKDVQLSIGQIFQDMAERRAKAGSHRKATTHKIREVQRLCNTATGRFMNVLEAEPGNTNALVGIAAIAFVEENKRRAFEYVRLALSASDNQSAPAWELLGRLYKASNQPDLWRVCAFNAQMVKEGNFPAIKTQAAQPASGIVVNGQNLDTL